VPARAGAAPTKSGRPGTARRVGPGEQDETAYERNRCHNAPQAQTPPQIWWIGGGSGASPGPARRWRGTPEPACVVGREATVKVCGVTVGEAAGAQLDASLVDRAEVNVGTVRSRPRPCGQRGSRAGAPSAEGTGWGGDPVVVRARESLCTWPRGSASRQWTQREDQEVGRR
jgi:hypothetical protein